MGLDWEYGDGQSGSYIGRAWVGVWHGAWAGVVVVMVGVMCGGVGKVHVYTTWICEVGLEHWWRSGW